MAFGISGQSKIKPRVARTLWILVLLILVGATVFSILTIFKDNLVLFYTPTQLVNGEIPKEHVEGRPFRVGGMVEKSSLVRQPGTTYVTFNITDMANTVRVSYNGVTPDLFKEGKGVVAQGKMKDNIFVATEILAKHDENYSPPKLK